MLDWADDVAELLDRIDVDRFAAMSREAARQLAAVAVAARHVEHS